MRISRNNITIHFQSSRILIVMLKAEGLQLSVACLYAPHEEVLLPTPTVWWEDTNKIHGEFLSRYQTIYFIDANAQTRRSIPGLVGDFFHKQAKGLTHNRFSNFIKRLDLVAVNTFF